MTNNSYLAKFRSARNKSVPIIVIRTADNIATIDQIGKFLIDEDRPAATLQWDCVNGITAVNADSIDAAKKMTANQEGQSAAMVSAVVGDALGRINSAPAGALIFMHNLHMPIEHVDPSQRLSAMQGIKNIRETFKSDGRTLVILCPGIKLPPELINDAVVIDAELPDVKVLEEIIMRTLKSVEMAPKSLDELDRAVDAISGLSEFAAEQVVALSLRKSGLDIDRMWDQKRTIIEQSGGLSVSRETATFDALGGMENVKRFLRLVMKGKKKPRVVCLFDEIEKSLAGADGDNTGVTQDSLGVILSEMQDNEWSGVLFPGFPGTGKTQIAKALGSESGGIFIKVDLGGMKSKNLGDSEKAIRSTVKILKAMGGKNVFFVGTCNSMDSLKPELLRRFGHGIYFFDLPTAEEREPIWTHYLGKYKIPMQARPDDSNWTGAEIEKACQRADELSITLTEAAQFITPVFNTMGKKVKALRQSASGKYLSASTPGLYAAPGGDKPPMAPR